MRIGVVACGYADGYPRVAPTGTPVLVEIDLDAPPADVPDAYLAALAIEHGATWITTDRGFARFPGLRWRLPLD